MKDAAANRESKIHHSFMQLSITEANLTFGVITDNTTQLRILADSCMDRIAGGRWSIVELEWHAMLVLPSPSRSPASSSLPTLASVFGAIKEEPSVSGGGGDEDTVECDDDVSNVTNVTCANNGTEPIEDPLVPEEVKTNDEGASFLGFSVFFWLFICLCCCLLAASGAAGTAYLILLQEEK